MYNSDPDRATDDIHSEQNAHLAQYATTRNLKVFKVKGNSFYHMHILGEEAIEHDSRFFLISSTNCPTDLDVTLFALFRSNVHASAIFNKIRSRNKILNSLSAGT